MNLLSLFRKPAHTEAIAGLRDEVIALGTHVRFLVADQQKPQPRDTGGRFVTSKPDTKAMLERLVSKLDDKERRAAIAAGADRGRG